MRGTRLVMLVVGVALAGVAGAAPPAPCPGGRYLVTEGTLLGAGELLVVDDETVELTSGCPAATVRVRARRSGVTQITARWKGCAGITGVAILKASIVDGCTRVRGTLRTPKTKPKRRAFEAEPSRCGDAVTDGGGGEACDGADVGSCLGACAADCTCAPTTTTSTTLPALTGVHLLTASNVLVRVPANSPQTVVDTLLVTGIDLGTRLIGIDVRPATGELFGVGVGISGGTVAAQVYVIDPRTGVATRVGESTQTFTNATRWGIDFNPTVDRIRIVNEGEENGRLNPTSGARADAPTADTNLNPIGGDVIAVAYDRNVAGGASTDTTLYAIRRATSTFVTVGGIDQTPSANSGTITLVGALGITLSATADAGLDVFGTPGTALAALTTSAGQTGLYIVSLATGAATLVGPIGDGATSFVSLAVAADGP